MLKPLTTNLSLPAQTSLSFTSRRRRVCFGRERFVKEIQILRKVFRRSNYKKNLKNLFQMKFYKGNIKPSENTIFVFGSNPEGRHGAGAARIARIYFGAIYGKGEGLQGHAYALPTKDLRVRENNGFRSISPEKITENIKRLYECARQHPSKDFCIAYRNTSERSLNGYTGYEMMQMFKNAGTIPNNIVFSEEWRESFE